LYMFDKVIIPVFNGRKTVKSYQKLP